MVLGAAAIAIGIGTAAIGVVGGLLATPAGRVYLTRTVEEQLDRRLRGRARVGEAAIAQSGEVVLHDVEIRDAEGRVAIAAREVRAQVSFAALAARRVRITRLVVEGGLLSSTLGS